MKEESTSKRSSRKRESKSNSGRRVTKYCNDGLVYWIQSDRDDCIAYGKIPYDEHREFTDITQR